MKIFLLAVLLIGLSLIGLCFNIIFKKNGKFPDGEISHNKALTKQGIQCAKVEEKKLWGKKSRKRENCSEDDCADCGCGCGITNN